MTEEKKGEKPSPLTVDLLLNENEKDERQIEEDPFPNDNVSINNSPNKPRIKKGPWTDKEHEDFLRGYKEVGKKWTIIANNYVKTRNGQQVACHGQKYLKKLLKKEMNIIQYHKYEIGENEKLKKNKL